jgi:hypothetical protein
MHSGSMVCWMGLHAMILFSGLLCVSGMVYGHFAVQAGGHWYWLGVNDREAF